MSAHFNDESSTNRHIQRWLDETKSGSVQKPDPNTVTRSRTRTYENRRNQLLDQIDSAVLTTLSHPINAREKQSRSKDGQNTRSTVTAPGRSRQTSRDRFHSRQLPNWVLQEATAGRRRNGSDAQSNNREMERSREMATVADLSTKYAKKARQKVKSDKYEYKGEIQAKKNPRNRKRKRTRSGSVGKDFHAYNIDAERVTLKPNCEQFVFSRSKMSMPLAGHDLPDLTFTKMDFLSRPRSSTHRGLTKDFIQQDKRDGIPRKNTKVHVRSDITVKGLQIQRISAKSDSCSAALSEISSRNDLIRASRTRGGIIEAPRRMTEKPTWVRSKVDSRLEEYQPVCTSTDSATPISWPTSPPPKDYTQDAYISPQAAIVSSSREEIDTGTMLSSCKTQIVKARSSTSNDICDDLTHRLLQKNVQSNTVLSRQDTPKRYQSLEDLKTLSERMYGRRSSDEESPKRSNPLHSRPPIGLRGRVDAYTAHGPPLYIDDIIQQQYDQIPYFTQAARRQPTQGNYESMPYNNGLAISDRHTLSGTDGVTHVTHTDVIERPQSSVEFRRCFQEHNLAAQQLDSSAAWAKPTEFRQGRDALGDDTADFVWNEEEQLDEFDLELLETAKMRVSGQGFLPVADLRHPNQANDVRFRLHCATANPASGILPPMSFVTNGPAENSTLRTRKESEVQEKEQSLVIDRPSLQHGNSQSIFNPFRRGWMSF